MAASFSASLQELRRDLEGLAALHAGHSTSRADHLGRQLEQLGNDLTELLGLRLEENAATHDLLASRIAHADAALGALHAQVSDVSRCAAPLLDDASIRRRQLHDALAWYPTWSALAPLGAEPLVSVIVPTRDRRHRLQEALASIERQTYGRWEAVVVNDGSTDDTGALLDELARTDERIRRFDTAGLGSGGARQHGLEQARGDVIAYLDDDNLMTDGWLRAVVEALVRSPELSAVYGGQLREMDWPIPWLLLEPFDEVLLLEGNFIDIGAFAHRAVPGLQFRSDVDGFEDWSFLLSFAEAHSIVPLPTIASVYLTRAPGRVSVAWERHESEEAVRSNAVRRRLADPEFVDRALARLSEQTPLSANESGAVTPADVEWLVGTIRNIARRRRGSTRILVWDSQHMHDQVRGLLGLHGIDANWLVIATGAASEVEPVRSLQPDLWLDGSTSDPGGIAGSVLDGPLTYVWLDTDAGAPDADASAAIDLSLPERTGLTFDVVIVVGPAPEAHLSAGRRVVAGDGVVLLWSDDRSTTGFEATDFESWRAVGDEFWVGSPTQTDFTDVVPIRALLRGIERDRARR